MKLLLTSLILIVVAAAWITIPTAPVASKAPAAIAVPRSTEIKSPESKPISWTALRETLTPTDFATQVAAQWSQIDAFTRTQLETDGTPLLFAKLLEQSIAKQDEGDIGHWLTALEFSTDPQVPTALLHLGNTQPTRLNDLAETAHNWAMNAGKHDDAARTQFEAKLTSRRSTDAERIIAALALAGYREDRILEKATTRSTTIAPQLAYALKLSRSQEP